MKSTQKSNWLVPTGLILLSVIPILAGSVRLLQIGSGAVITPENARFMAAPLPVVLHIFSSVIYCVLGAFQFSASFRRRHPNWHRMSGRILIPLGLISALSGLWMTQFYPHPGIGGPLIPANFDDQYLYAIRLLVGVAMAVFICLGFAAIRRRDIPSHRAWMMRGYALGIGAGTQAFTHIPWFLFASIHGELARTICMAAGWGINLAVAEWLISRHIRQIKR
jgi:uncharacterized membrane protein